MSREVHPIVDSRPTDRSRTRITGCLLRPTRRGAASLTPDDSSPDRRASQERARRNALRKRRRFVSQARSTTGTAQEDRDMTPATATPMRTRTGSIPTQTSRPTLEIEGRIGPRYDEILTPEAIRFLIELHDRFGARRHDRLADRMRRRFEIGNGHDPQFRDDTRHIREDAEWRVAGAGPGLEDRRVEITGPTDPKMTINALNSGAKVWLADQEDATSPTWTNVIEGQLSLRDAIRGELGYTSPDGKRYEVTATETPTIVMRPRGWHLPEHHVRFTDRFGRTLPASGSLVDFGLYFFHNALQLIANG